ncbi:hypothetical protein HAT2_00187 [Candidatus Similichlamydia laticola]|uniref:Uncharacterized protein n=1 Tax=Candidatus Similichlamydia laticola TaxID=2170265 RepID=A0A369KAP3_9BACT|nr:hypothetical protein HAT2_00187 [Candidatus Similichlamydia laticola]
MAYTVRSVFLKRCCFFAAFASGFSTIHLLLDLLPSQISASFFYKRTESGKEEENLLTFFSLFGTLLQIATSFVFMISSVLHLIMAPSFSLATFIGILCYILISFFSYSHEFGVLKPPAERGQEDQVSQEPCCFCKTVMGIFEFLLYPVSELIRRLTDKYISPSETSTASLDQQIESICIWGKESTCGTLVFCMLSLFSFLFAPNPWLPTTKNSFLLVRS